MPDELSALATLAADTVDRIALAPVQGLHRAVAERVFRANGPAAAPVRAVHDLISDGVYGGLRRTVVGGGTLAAAAIRRVAADADPEVITRSRPGRLAVSAVNGIIGDRLEESASELAVRMTVRRRGAVVPIETAALRRAHPRATGRIAVLLHGLCETEDWWRLPARVAALERADGPVAPPRRSLGARLRREAGVTPVEVRYNTGLHVSDNGQQLATLLEALVSAWPVALTEVALVGHSMGGLVARSAAHIGTAARHGWTGHVRHVVTLGTPHTGSFVEKGIHAAAWALRALPETRPLADILDLRSVGIRDLCFGYLSEEDWREADRRALLADGRRDVPLLPGCTHTFVVARVTRDPGHPLGHLVGDLLVRTDSARGHHRTRAIRVPDESVVELGGLTHLDLLGHPLVGDIVCRLLRDPARVAAGDA